MWKINIIDVEDGDFGVDLFALTNAAKKCNLRVVHDRLNEGAQSFRILTPPFQKITSPPPPSFETLSGPPSRLKFAEVAIEGQAGKRFVDFMKEKGIVCSQPTTPCENKATKKIGSYTFKTFCCRQSLLILTHVQHPPRCIKKYSIPL
jgi:hypothetical protein